MEMPIFTIAIPTHNRCDFLKQSLSAALSQSYANLQVLICDNASTDGTEAFIKTLRDSRITYHRHTQNIGAQRNFASAVDMASGEYFSWLQDDDLITTDFACRATEVLQSFNANLYLGSAYYSTTTTSMHFPKVYCPPCVLDWMGKTPSVISTEEIFGLSYLTSVAIPPVIAFRTKSLRKYGTSINSESFPLFAERTILCDMSLSGTVVADPVCCGLFRQHNAQSSQVWTSERGRYRKEWTAAATYIDKLAEDTDLAHSDKLEECFMLVPEPTLENWALEVANWPTGLCKATEVKHLIIGANHRRNVSDFSRNSVLRRIANDVTPPFIKRQGKTVAKMLLGRFRP